MHHAAAALQAAHPDRLRELQAAEDKALKRLRILVDREPWAEILHEVTPNGPHQGRRASRRSLASGGSAKITQRQLESILKNNGIIQAAAIEDPEGYDGGKTELAMRIATQQINEQFSPNAKLRDGGPMTTESK